MLYDLAVIGGGAAGLSAAIAASSSGDRVIVLEAGNAIGKKILVSGNGRCNLMNTGKPRYFGDADFARQVLDSCGAQRQNRFWHDIGLMTAEESEHRVYPCTFQSSSVISVLKNALLIRQVRIELNTPVTECEFEQDRSFRLVAGKKTVRARRVLVATGGPAGRKADGDTAGYDILRKFRHTITPLHPALVPLLTDARSISGLSGIRVRCGISLLNRNRAVIHREHGELLFTDYGVSGICAMQCGRFIDGDGYCLEIDLAEKLFEDNAALTAELRSRKRKFGSMPPDTLLIGILNPKLAYAVMKQAGVTMKEERLDDLEDGILGNVVRVLRCYRVNIIGTKGMPEAQVTSGGADCREFRPDNMESRIVPGLHAAGEILNTDGDCGGYNLMFAFGSGILAGLNGR